MTRGLIIAAPSSGSGKTTVTLGLLGALRRNGVAVRGAKSGPDYIDPRFHEAACAAPCPNLDAWAMTPDRLRSLAAGEGLLLIEGAMGLFDGAPPDGKGATADLARVLGLPVVLVVDAAKMAQSVAALVAGFARHDAQVRVAGLILNRVGSPRHEDMLRRALAPLGLPVLGALYRQSGMAHPSRHLGLVQAGEHPDLQRYLSGVADAVQAAVDLDALVALAAPLPGAAPATPLPPPAQSIAIASDAAFAFAYPHLLADWRAAGAQIAFFSPLADQPPPPCDLVFLPGGYPELHAGRLAAAESFRTGMEHAAQTGQIYGECGGYMVLGDGLSDADGTRHRMLGLLALETSFAQRKLHLGYRQLGPLGGPFTAPLMGHEFHYASTLRAKGPALFRARDAEGNTLPDMGLRAGRVSGSFAHVIDRAG
jgi:cobyrinic acid a,c-diamide synthase